MYVQFLLILLFLLCTAVAVASGAWPRIAACSNIYSQLLKLHRMKVNGMLCQ